MIAQVLRTEFLKYPQIGNLKTRALDYNGWKWQKHYQTAFPAQRNQTRFYDNHVDYACTKNTSLHTFFVCFTVKYDSFCCLVVVLSHGVSISTVVILTSANETREIWTRFPRVRWKSIRYYIQWFLRHTVASEIHFWLDLTSPNYSKVV